MELKNLLNADVLQENASNRIELEHIIGIVPNNPCYVEHSIYFAESLYVFEDAEKTVSLTEGTDYIFAEMDTIASEQSNKDCYRAITFLKEIDNAYMSYHSYGDIVTAETINTIINEVNAGADNTEALEQTIDNLSSDVTNHVQEKKAHGATETVAPDTIAFRTPEGTLKAADPISDDDLVSLQFQKQAIQISEQSTQEKISEAESSINGDIEKLDDKIKATTPAVTLQDFLPEDIEEPTAEDNATAQQALDARVNETNAYHNAVRNERGSITIPDAVNENEAINKKALDVVNQKAGDNTIAIENLTEIVSQIDTSSNYTDNFVFDSTKVMGTKIETNKIWNDKKVYRVGVTFEGTGSNNSYWTPISNDYTIINAFGVSVSSSGVSKGISFSDIIFAKNTGGTLQHFFSVYAERYTTCYLSFEYVE